MQALIYMATQPLGTPILNKDIAAKLNVPAPYLAKILQSLAKGNLLYSFRGRLGGFCLKEDGLKTSLMDIVLLTEGPAFTQSCLLGLKKCSDETACPVHFRWSPVKEKTSLNCAGDRAVGTYSGGMVQRLGLAVTMLPDAPVLLLDEPTAALGPDGLCAFYGIVSQHRREGKTILFTSHQLGDVERLADRIAVLVQGRLVASLTARELADRLSDRGRMRVRVAGARADLLGRVRAIAPGATWMADDLVIPGSAPTRPAVLEVLRLAGAEINAIITKEGRLDDLYRDLVESGGEHR